MAKNEVRIIGGKWRGRKLKFPDAKGLRPSQDRARETLFNWIAPWIDDARVLDLFAGSGVLGFEALSRGAASADLVDTAKAVIAALELSKTRLDANAAAIYHRDALKHLQRDRNEDSSTYDLVFIDPPFTQPIGQSPTLPPRLSIVAPTLGALLANGRLAQGGLVYVEQPKREPLPQGFSVFRNKAFGDSRALLLEPDLESPQNA